MNTKGRSITVLSFYSVSIIGKARRKVSYTVHFVFYVILFQIVINTVDVRNLRMTLRNNEFVSVCQIQVFQ